MNITQWKDRINQKLAVLFFKANAELPHSTYGAISAATLLPLIDAFAAGGPGAFWAAAGPVLGGVGSSLLANRMQQWADQQSSAPSSDEFVQQLATTLSEEASNNAELRTALDEMNQALDSLTLAAQATDAEDRATVVQALRTELSQLGNLDRYAETINRIENSGSGSTLVGDNGKAGGERSVVADTINAKTLNTGDTTHHHHYPNPPSTETTTPKPATPKPDHLTTYLHALRTDCDALPLAAMGGETGAGRELCLGDVYIALDTTAQVKMTAEEKAEVETQRGYEFGDDEPTRPIKAQEAADQNDHLLLLGDPGSGKSTFVRQLTARNATELLKPKRARLPIFVVLHELIAGLSRLADDEAFQQARQRERHKQLVALFSQEWTRRFDEWAIADFEEAFIDKARAVQSDILLVLDGLDEIPERLRPLLIDEALPALTSRFAGIKQIIVTCRIRSYFDGMLPGYTSYTLADFTDEQIDNFVAAWYKTQQQLGRMDLRRAEQNISELQTAARGNLRELASNPMLLTTMTIIHQREKKLPDQRVELYKLAVEVLMNRWQQGKDQVTNLSPELDALLANNRKLRLILERLAYEAHKAQAAAGKDDALDDGAENRGGQQPLRRGDLLVLLEELLDSDTGLADEFLDYIDHRAGLLVGRGGSTQDTAIPNRANRNPQTYSFPHRTFQEYLAGCYMNQGRNYARTYRSHLKEGDYWRVAALLGAEEFFYNNNNQTAVLDLAYTLCPVAAPQNEEGWRGVVWSAQMAALLERTDIEEDNEDPDGGPAYLERLLTRLVEFSHTKHFSMTERAEAGQALGHLGDPRFNPDAWYLPIDPDLGFTEIAAGTFKMGSKPEVDTLADEDEQPQHPLHLARFLISRYQVTVAQWRTYCEAKEYQPYDTDSLRDPDNHPVRYISWEEAMAYCQWLTKRLRDWNQTPEPLATLLRSGDESGTRWQITLPTEAQWERAARGTDGLLYPYGNEFDATLGNTIHTGIGRPIAVGFFPKGKSPAECLDMSGNLYDWTLTKWQNNEGEVYGYPYDATDGRENLDDSGAARVVRGGSFSCFQYFARAAHRFFIDNASNDVGVRVVCAPIPSAL